MALPTADCFRGLDQRDQLTAIYESALNLSGGGEFDPNSIPGLILWIDGDHVIEEGGIVGEMIDRSSGGHTVASVVDGIGLNVGALNGHNTVSFNTSQQLTVTPGINTSSGTIVAVAAIDASMSANYAPIFISQNNRMCAKTASSGGDWGTFTSGGDLNGTTTLTSGNWHILILKSAGGGTGTRLILDGVQEATSVNASSGTSVTSIGNEEGFPRFLQGDIAEELYYDSFLSTENEEALVTYLRNKYALP